jgi:hypothetical protein
MQKHQDKQIAKALENQRPHREEVALPERGGMDQELVPGSDAVLWSGVEAVADEDPCWRSFLSIQAATFREWPSTSELRAQRFERSSTPLDYTGRRA